eukprot:Gb_15637 [translate_table: standard]
MKLCHEVIVDIVGEFLKLGKSCSQIHEACAQMVKRAAMVLQDRETIQNLCEAIAKAFDVHGDDQVVQVAAGGGRPSSWYHEVTVGVEGRMRPRCRPGERCAAANNG